MTYTAEINRTNKLNSIMNLHRAGDTKLLRKLIVIPGIEEHYF